jgi:hypothetical protein
MKHVHLTCKKHSTLRWHCKEIAYTNGEGYNGTRNIFFEGEAGKENEVDKHWKVVNGDLVNTLECDCPSSLLVKV